MLGLRVGRCGFESENEGMRLKCYAEDKRKGDIITLILGRGVNILIHPIRVNIYP